MMVGCFFQNAAGPVLALHLQNIQKVDICELCKGKTKTSYMYHNMSEKSKEMTCQKSFAIFLLCMSHLSCISGDRTYQL